MADADLRVFMGEAARQQFLRRMALAKGFVAADRITTLARLRRACARAAQRAGLLPNPEADFVARLLLFSRAAEEAALEFKGRGPLGSALPQALVDVAESIEALLAPFGALAERLHEWLLQNPPGSKLQQIGRLYSIYRQHLQQAGLADSRDVHAAVLTLLQGPRRHWPPLLNRNEGTIHFQAMSWLDPFAEQMVHALARQLGQGRVRLSSALPPAHAEAMEDRLAARIRSEVLSGPEEDSWASWSESLGDALAVEDAQLAVDSREHIRFVQSVGARGEVEDLAREILREMEERRIPAERVALVVRPSVEYLEILAEVFGRFGLPFCSRRGRPLSGYPAVRALRALLHFPVHPTRDRLCALLQSPALIWPGLGDFMARRQVAQDLQAAGLAPRLNPADWRPGGSRPAHLPPPLWSILVRTLAQLGLDERAPLEGPLAEHARRALKIADEFGLAQAADSAPVSGRERLANRQALNQALEVLRRLGRENTGPGQAWTRGRFLDLLTRCWGGLIMPADYREEYGVWVLAPSEMAGLQFDVVAIAGLNEGAFPAWPREDALLSDEERLALREVLANRGVEWPQWSLPLSWLRSTQERLQFLTCLGAARERLILSCQTADEEGRPLNPGDFFRSVWLLAGNGLPATQGASWQTTRPLPSCRTVSEAWRRIGRLLENPELAELPEKALVASLADAEGGGIGERVEHGIGVEQAREEFFNTPADARPPAAIYCGKLGSSTACQRIRGWRQARGALSPTALESLARCRFQFLLGTICKLDVLRLREETADPLERGRLLHTILEQFYRALRGDPGEPSALTAAERADLADLCRTRSWAVEETPGNWRLRETPGGQHSRSLPLAVFLFDARERYNAMALRIAEALFTRAEAEGQPLGDAGLWETEKPKLRQIVRNYVALDVEQAAAERRFPALVEMDFGQPGQPRVWIGSPENGLSIRGRVDRVDLRFDEAGHLRRILIVDYKGPGFGAWPLEAYITDIADNLNCQLPLYAFAVQQYLFGRHNEPDLNALTDMVFHVQDRDAQGMTKQFLKKRIPLAGDLHPDLAEQFTWRLAHHWNLLQAADFSVDPRNCDYCEFRGVCRVDINALAGAAAAAQDP